MAMGDARCSGLTFLLRLIASSAPRREGFGDASCFFILRVSVIMSWGRLCGLSVDRMTEISVQVVSLKVAVCRRAAVTVSFSGGWPAGSTPSLLPPA
jgi:hypothetical protein